MKQLFIVLNNFRDVSHNQHILRLITYLTARNFNIVILTLSPTGPLQPQFGSLPLVRHVTLAQFIQALKNSSTKIILTKELRSEYVVFLIRFVLGWSRLRHVTIRPSYGFLPESLWKIIKNVLFTLSMQLVDINIAVGKTVYNRMHCNNKVCIPNSVAESFTQQPIPPKCTGKTIKFVYTGFLEDRKNLTYAMKLLDTIAPDITLDVLGEGPQLAELRRISKKYRYKTIFHGNQHNVIPYLNHADCFIFPSKMEGLSLSLLEAMARGLVCIVSNIPENTEIIQHGYNGIVVPLDQPEQAGKIVQQFLNNKQQIRELSRHAHQTIASHYTDRISFEAYAKILLQ